MPRIRCRPPEMADLRPPPAQRGTHHAPHGHCPRVQSRLGQPRRRHRPRTHQRGDKGILRPHRSDHFLPQNHRLRAGTERSHHGPAHHGRQKPGIRPRIQWFRPRDAGGGQTAAPGGERGDQDRQHLPPRMDAGHGLRGRHQPDRGLGQPLPGHGDRCLQHVLLPPGQRGQHVQRGHHAPPRHPCPQALPPMPPDGLQPRAGAGGLLQGRRQRRPEHLPVCLPRDGRGGVGGSGQSAEGTHPPDVRQPHERGPAPQLPRLHRPETREKDQVGTLYPGSRRVREVGLCRHHVRHPRSHQCQHRGQDQARFQLQ